MPKISDYKPGARQFALHIGRSGSGKSCASASFPGSHISDFDGRIGGVANYKDIIAQEVTYDYYPPGKKGWSDVDTYLEILGLQIAIKQTSVQTEILSGLGNLCEFLIAESLDLQGGQVIGKQGGDPKHFLRVAGPNDYRYERQALGQIFNYLKSLPINIIAECHITDRFGKPGIDKTGTMSPEALAAWQHQILETVDLGDKLDLRPQIEQFVMGKFDEIYLFEKKKGKYYVTFQSDLARTCLPLPKGEIDITGKNFYKIWLDFIQKGTPNAHN